MDLNESLSEMSLNDTNNFSNEKQKTLPPTTNTNNSDSNSRVMPPRPIPPPQTKSAPPPMAPRIPGRSVLPPMSRPSGLPPMSGKLNNANSSASSPNVMRGLPNGGGMASPTGGAPPTPGGLRGRRAGIPPTLGAMGGLTNNNSSSGGGGRMGKPGLNLSQLGLSPKPSQTPFANFSKYVDPSGKLNFSGKAIIHADGVDFSNGNSFTIKMDDLILQEELGKGQYGTVQKVKHRVTNVTMAMKEIRLELDETKLHQILMELDILHKSSGEYIVEFYGAFFIESCVYYCMEYMDAGSLDKLYGKGVPEDVLAKIAISMVKGLKFLKDELSIIHRDVKPTNVLANLKGQVKLCDFGVSGQLEKSLAKTNIGCQSYMAPERIRAANTYSVSSDVWSLGISLVEMAIGRYPYKYDNMFAQLKAIIDDEPPSLPADQFSMEARDFVAACLQREPQKRPTYAELLEHPFIKKYEEIEVDMAKWATEAHAAAMEAKKK